mmetsp:Transcript_33715/g.62062  ORF Transcript_33715/g.62062 Transcript_33715/m.62062 type:complete len:98 (-) Transcript_33715:175-468(-)
MSHICVKSISSPTNTTPICSIFGVSTFKNSRIQKEPCVSMDSMENTALTAKFRPVDSSSGLQFAPFPKLILDYSSPLYIPVDKYMCSAPILQGSEFI